MPAKKTVDKKRGKEPVAVQQDEHETTTTEQPDAKKRARKPRGSKIVTKQQIASITSPAISNIVLNLKCSMNDLREYNERLSRMIINPLEYNSSAPPEVKFYDGNKQFGALIGKSETSQTASNSSFHNKQSSGDIFSSTKSTLFRNTTEENWSNQTDPPKNEDTAAAAASSTHQSDLEQWAESNRVIAAEDVNTKEMLNKLKQLKIQLYKNALHSEKKSACFWCTYDFDNAPCYIPKYEMDGTIYGYGSLCRPECAVAYLMKESIDDSTKFDRYHLLNQIYSKVYECKKNIKPAPDPHYLLEKFYGNLSIQEYRKLLRTEHLLLVIDKPLTRILPELHEDNDDAFTKIYGIKPVNGNATGVYKVKRQSEQPAGPSKSSIIKNTFGIAN
jgi:hypothetical protein